MTKFNNTLRFILQIFVTTVTSSGFEPDRYITKLNYTLHSTYTPLTHTHLPYLFKNAFRLFFFGKKEKRKKEWSHRFKVKPKTNTLLFHNKNGDIFDTYIFDTYIFDKYIRYIFYQIIFFHTRWTSLVVDWLDLIELHFYEEI